MGRVAAAYRRLRHTAIGRRPWRVAVAGLAAAALLAGCGAGIGATAASTTAVATSGSGDVATASASAARRGPGGGQSPTALRANLQATLAPLVNDNTLTSAQEGAVLTALSQRPGRANANTSGRASATASATTAASGSVSSPASGARPGGPGAAGFSNFQRQTLDPLVQQGTITATQETAVLQALQQAAAARRPNGTPQPGSPAGA